MGEPVPEVTLTDSQCEVLLRQLPGAHRSILLVGQGRFSAELLHLLASNFPESQEHNLIGLFFPGAFAAEQAQVSMPHVTCVDMLQPSPHSGYTLFGFMLRADADMYFCEGIVEEEDLRMASVSILTGHSVIASIKLAEGVAPDAWYREHSGVVGIAQYDFFAMVDNTGFNLESRDELWKRLQLPELLAVETPDQV